MQVTAEIRWFWREDGTTTVADWFCSSESHGLPPAEARERVDRYLVDVAQTELGIKARGGKPGLEIKGLVSREIGTVSHGPYEGPIEIWTKWSTSALDLEVRPVIDVAKRRWQRAFDMTQSPPEEATERIAAWFHGEDVMPARGCNVEVTRVVASGDDVWWTLGFEAFGDLTTVAADLVAAAQVMSGRNAPPMRGATRQSYPEWLAGLAVRE